MSTPDIVQAAAARAAHLRAELKKLEGVETLATQARHARMSPSLQLSRHTFALGDGQNFGVHFDDADLAAKVRELIAADREAKAAALIGGDTIPSPQQQAEQPSPPAPEPTVASSAAAVDSTPSAQDLALDTARAAALDAARAAAERAYGAGYRYRAEQHGQRKSPYKPGPLTEAWLAGWDEADAQSKAEAATNAGETAGGRSSAYMAGRAAFASGRFGSASEAEAQAGYDDRDDAADFRRGFSEAEEEAASDVDPMAATPTPAAKAAPAETPAAKAAPKSTPRKGLF